MPYTIDAISAESPDMSESEAQALKESIANIGQQVPILVWRGRVVDGRKRMAACEALGVEPIVTTLADDDDPAPRAVALNVLRTHYTPSQRAAFAERIATATKSQAAKKWRNGEQDVIASCYPPTHEQAAKAFGIQKGMIGVARRIRRTSAPEVMEAVEAGTLTLHAASQVAAKVPHENQSKVVAELVREKKGKRNAPSKIINAAAPGKRLPPRRDIGKVRGRSLQTIHACCSALDQFMDAPFGPGSDLDGWREWLREINRTLTRFHRRLENAHERSA